MSKHILVYGIPNIKDNKIISCDIVIQIIDVVLGAST